MESIELSAIFNAAPDFLYDFFLDSALHSKITESEANISRKIGGRFTAWDDYISGEIIGLEENKKIIQKWRTSDFSENAADSLLEIAIEDLGNNRAKLTLTHSDLPEGTARDYAAGWRDYFFIPLEKYLAATGTIAG